MMPHAITPPGGARPTQLPLYHKTPAEGEGLCAAGRALLRLRGGVVSVMAYTYQRIGAWARGAFHVADASRVPAYRSS